MAEAFQSRSTCRCTGMYPARSKVSVTVVPPLRATVYPPSSRVAVWPSSGWSWTATRTPAIGPAVGEGRAVAVGAGGREPPGGVATGPGPGGPGPAVGTGVGEGVKPAFVTVMVTARQLLDSLRSRTLRAASAQATR